MHSNRIIDQVALTVKNLEQVMIFYKEQLGFQVIDQTAHRAVLSADGKNGLLILEENKDAKPRALYSTGLYHIAFYCRIVRIWLTSSTISFKSKFLYKGRLTMM
ncbi:VOC family protein [Bacillus sp. N9]